MRCVRARGFSLTELLLSIAIIFIVSVFSFPVGMNFYKTQILRETTDELAGALRRAHIQSLAQKNDAGYGIKIFEDRYVLFEGTAYEARDVNEDEIFNTPSPINITGLTEVVFEQMTGMPNATGTVHITIGTDEEIIEVREQGMVER